MASYGDINKQIEKSLFYFKKQQKIIDAHKTRASMVSIRNKWLEQQNVKNYQSEYDRLVSLLKNSTAARNGSPTIEHIEKRTKDLEKMGAKAVFQIA